MYFFPYVKCKKRNSIKYPTMSLNEGNGVRIVDYNKHRCYNKRIKHFRIAKHEIHLLVIILQHHSSSDIMVINIKMSTSFLTWTFNLWKQVFNRHIWLCIVCHICITRSPPPPFSSVCKVKLTLLPICRLHDARLFIVKYCFRNCKNVLLSVNF